MRVSGAGARLAAGRKTPRLNLDAGAATKCQISNYSTAAKTAAAYATVKLGMPPTAVSFPAAPAEATTMVISAPVPAGTMPAVPVPALAVTAPAILDLLDRREAIDRRTHTSRRDRRVCIAGDGQRAAYCSED
jgi:hypothetical protein